MRAPLSVAAAAAVLVLSGDGAPLVEASVESSPPASAVADAALSTRAESVLRPGDTMVLASWQCSFLQLERVNEVALGIIESPLTEATEEGFVQGWGQLNGSIRDEYNYHTFYITRSVEDYRRALGRVLTYMSQETPDLMDEFYDLCETTRETTVTVVTARP